MSAVVMSERSLRQGSVNPPPMAARLFWKAAMTSTMKVANPRMRPTSIAQTVRVLPVRPAVVVRVAAITVVVGVPVAVVVDLAVVAVDARIILMIEKRAVTKQSAFLFPGNPAAPSA